MDAGKATRSAPLCEGRNASPESENLACSDIFHVGTERSLHSPSCRRDEVGRVAQVLNRNATMHDVGKSDVGVVPLKGQNKPGKPGADVLEGRPATKGNLLQTTVTGAQYPEPTLSGLERIRQVASVVRQNSINI